MSNIVTIDFHGDRLLGIEDPRGAYIALRPLVLGMGLDWSAQFRRLKRDPILAEAVAMMATGSDPEAVCLPLDLVPGFLFRIDASRVEASIRPRVLDYQRSCFAVLAQALARPSARPVEGNGGPAGPMTLPRALKLVMETRRTFGPRSARELWLQLGLPTVRAMLEHDVQPSQFREG